MDSSLIQSILPTVFHPSTLPFIPYLQFALGPSEKHEHPRDNIQTAKQNRIRQGKSPTQKLDRATQHEGKHPKYRQKHQ